MHLLVPVTELVVLSCLRHRRRVLEVYAVLLPGAGDHLGFFLGRRSLLFLDVLALRGDLEQLVVVRLVLLRGVCQLLTEVLDLGLYLGLLPGVKFHVLVHLALNFFYLLLQRGVVFLEFHYLSLLVLVVGLDALQIALVHQLLILLADLLQLLLHLSLLRLLRFLLLHCAHDHLAGLLFQIRLKLAPLLFELASLLFGLLYAAVLSLELPEAVIELPEESVHVDLLLLLFEEGEPDRVKLGLSSVS